MKIKAVAICGFSASGKDTLARNLKKEGCHAIVSTTSRPMRTGEVNSVDYNFISKEEFLNRIHSGMVLEYRAYDTHYKGVKDTWYYGTEVSEIRFGQQNVAVVDLDGAEYFKSYYGDECITIFLDLNTETRRQRCIDRGDYDPIEFNRRLDDDTKKFPMDKIKDLADVIIDASQTEQEILNIVKLFLKE